MKWHGNKIYHLCLCRKYYDADFTNGEFVSMPAYKASTKARDGESAYRDIVYPITKEFREQLFGEILNVYHEKKEEKLSEAKGKVEQGNMEVSQRKENTPFR